jgi:hypothetical protein
MSIMLVRTGGRIIRVVDLSVGMGWEEGADWGDGVEEPDWYCLNRACWSND